MTMKIAIVIFLVAVSFSCFATQDQILPVSFVHIKTKFNIQPQLLDHEFCQSKKCGDNAFEGNAEARVSLDEDTGELLNLEFSVDNTPIDVGELSELRSSRVLIYELSILSAPGYIPKVLRDEIVGLGSPRIYLRGIGYEAAECKSGYMKIDLVYDLETFEFEKSAYCWSD